MIWDDEEPKKIKFIKEQATQPEAAIPALAPKPVTETITFRDISDGAIRTGRVLRTITSTEHDNARVGKLPPTKLFLVAYESTTKQNDIIVIWSSLIVRPKKPRS